MGAHVFTKDPAGLTRFLKAMLWVILGLAVISLVSDLLQWQLLNSGHLGVREAEASDNRQQVIGIAQLIAYLVTGIVFLGWIYRANLNVRGFGAQNLKFTPGWAVGYYFIPFLNLVRPYRAMKEIWQASKSPDDWQHQEAPALLGWWWALLLLSGFLGQISFRMVKEADSVSQLAAATLISMGAGLVEVPLCLVALRLVSNILRMQQEVVGQI